MVLCGFVYDYCHFLCTGFHQVIGVYIYVCMCHVLCTMLIFLSLVLVLVLCEDLPHGRQQMYPFVLPCGSNIALLKLVMVTGLFSVEDIALWTSPKGSFVVSR